MNLYVEFMKIFWCNMIYVGIVSFNILMKNCGN